MSTHADGPQSCNGESLLASRTNAQPFKSMVFAQGAGRPGPPLYRSARAFVRDARHNRLLAVPAALYAVNNYLKFAMQLYFKPTTAKMLGNLKVGPPGV